MKTVAVNLPMNDSQGRRVGGYPMQLSIECATCIRWTEGLQCQAFPKGIPPVIYTGRTSHAVPFAGDHGLHYERRERRDVHTTDRTPVLEKP